MIESGADPSAESDKVSREHHDAETAARMAALNHELALEVAARHRADDVLLETERRLRAVISNAPVVLYAIDENGRFLLSEGRGLESLGLRPGEVLGQSVFELYAEHPEIIEHLRRAIAGETFSAEVAVGGRVFESWYSPRPSDSGEGGGMFGVAIDITKRVRAESALSESEERYALAVHGAHDGIWDWNLRSDHVFLSPRWSEMLGLDQTSFSGSPKDWFGRIHPDDLDRVRVGLAAHLDGKSPWLQEEYRMLHASGRWMWVLTRGLAVRDDEGRAYRIAGSQSDIDLRKIADERLLHAALHDPLTALPNRNLFLQRLERSIRRAASGDYAFAVLFLDLDRFKLINDGLGHLAGDALLVQVAERLSTHIRPSDTFARLGGDEFTILFEDLRDPSREVDVLCTRLQDALSRSFVLAGAAGEVFTSASIGVAIADRSYRFSEEILRDADTAMYRAKERGRSRYVVFDAEMRSRAIAQLSLDNDLRRAFERREFRVRYQPIVALASGEVVGFEALIRWDHPSRGEVAPEEFIGVAEDTGLIIPIGRWLLSETCRRMREWEQRFPGRKLGMSVNLSGREFSRPDLIETIAAVLAETGLEPSTLRLEMTETLIMESADSVLSTLTELKQLGVRLSIDDFGTGYSSLSRLHRFPIDTFKIDRSFVSRLGREDESPEIVRAIVSLARNLSMEVIAEGVETEAQVTALIDIGCRFAQGYWFAPALDESEVVKLLSQKQVDWTRY